MPDDTNTDITGNIDKWLRQATDEQLKNYLALIGGEQTRRYRLFARLESDFMGGCARFTWTG